MNDIKRYLEVISEALSSSLREDLEQYGIKVIETDSHNFEVYLTGSEKIPAIKFFKTATEKDMPLNHLPKLNDMFNKDDFAYKYRLNIGDISLEKLEQARLEAFNEAWLELLLEDIIVYVKKHWHDITGIELTNSEVVDIFNGEDKHILDLSRLELERLRNNVIRQTPLTEHPLNYDDVYEQVEYSEAYERKLKERFV